MRLDYIIINGTVYDGSGRPPERFSIGIKDDRIVLLNKIEDSKVRGSSIIDAKGLAIAPGFIDTHGHSEFTILADPSQEGKLFQGITTEINGNCGLSAAPLYGDYLKHRTADLKEYEIPYRWNTLGEYLQILENIKPALNFATLAGHGNIRGAIKGMNAGRPSADELREMKKLLEEALMEGAIGISTGLIYPPGIYSDTEELIELTKHGAAVSKRRPFIYTSHMRSESDRLIEAVTEVIEIGKRAGSSVHISHIKTAGRNNWHKIDRILEIIDKAKKRV